MAELRITIGARELDRWLLYYEEEPWGATRDNLHAAIVASVIANVNRDPKKGREFTPADFMILSASKREDREIAGRSALLGALRIAGKTSRKKRKEKAKVMKNGPAVKRRE